MPVNGTEREVRKIPEAIEACCLLHGQVIDHQYRNRSTRSTSSSPSRTPGRHRPSTWLSRDVAVWLTAGIGIVVVAALALLAGSAGITDLAPGAATIADGGLVVALLLGLAAGVWTCLA